MTASTFAVTPAQVHRSCRRRCCACRWAGFSSFHAAMKIFVFTPAGTAGYFTSIGLPGVLGYVTILAELLGGLALLGRFSRRASSRWR